jgi:6-phosphofructokinase 1
MKRVAVLTSGGDAPGMNAAIRAVVRIGVLQGYEMYGVRHGYTGLIAGDFVQLGPRDVGGIIQQGGTILGTSRCEPFKTDDGQSAAFQQLRARDLHALIVIGGNGSQTGAYALCRRGMPVVGIASTIDNDLFGSDISIGAMTALDVALEAVDRLRVTAASHQRAFLVEVMGRHSGFLAAMTAIAGGAEALVVPEVPTEPQQIARQLRASHERGKSHSIIVVGEGAKHNADSLLDYFRAHQDSLGIELRATRLGHVQRGGAPGVHDRLLASRLGAAAIRHLAGGGHDVLMGIRAGEIVATPLADVAGRTNLLDARYLDLAHELAT